MMRGYLKVMGESKRITENNLNYLQNGKKVYRIIISLHPQHHYERHEKSENQNHQR